MIRGGFRPWGRLDWLLKYFSSQKWSIFGSIATGDRSLATWRVLHSKKICNYARMLQIADIAMPFWGDEPSNRVMERREQYLREGGLEESIVGCDIRDNLTDILQYTNTFIEHAQRHIIIDISTFPKRFFYPIIKEVLRKTKDNTVIATYTRPETYDRTKPLAIDPGPWKSLPGFQEFFPDYKKKRTLIVGLGYEPLGLPQILRDGEFAQNRVHLLFPFPAAPAGYLRNWEFVRNLDSEVGPYSHEPIRVNGYDVSTIFDLILRHTDRANEQVVFAPYGTKPMSLAMCLYACSHSKNSAVYYTQPKSYNPQYSSGIRMVNGEPDTFAYCIRLDGKDLYGTTYCELTN